MARIHAPNDHKLNESYPIPKLLGKGTPKTWAAKMKLARQAAIKSRQLRQANQAQNTLCTWIYQLVDSAGLELKRTEMDEHTAAVKNRSIANLGLFWRRAPY